MVKEVIQMSQKEVDRLDIVQKVESKLLSQKEGAKQLNITTRQIRRIQCCYRQEGAKGLVSKHRGRKSNNKFSDEFKLKIAALMKKHYADFGPKFAHEKLNELHNEKLSVESLRQIMIEYKIWQPKITKTNKVFQRRTPRSRFGELIQIDGSPHDWFEGRAKTCTLIVFIDDATSKITFMQFFPTENTQGYMAVTKQHLLKYGRPVSLYSDKHSVFNANGKYSQDTNAQTQFHRAMKTLGIELILAKTPQAKGRVERVNRTLQDRLVKEMRLKGISTIEQGNIFLEEYREKHNQLFSKQALNDNNAHRTVRQTKRELDLILSIHHTRKVSKSLEFTFGNHIHQLDKSAHHLKQKYISLCDLFKNELVVVYNNKEIDYKVFNKLIPQISSADEKTINQLVDTVIEDQRKISHIKVDSTEFNHVSL
jgi:thiamine kinase-like enzyme